MPGAVLSIVLFDRAEQAGQLGTKGAVSLKELEGGGRCEGQGRGVSLGRAVNSFLSCSSANRTASVTLLNASWAVRTTGTFVDQVHLLFAGNQIR